MAAFTPWSSVTAKKWDQLAPRFATSVCWTPIAALTPSSDFLLKQVRPCPACLWQYFLQFDAHTLEARSCANLWLKAEFLSCLINYWNPSWVTNMNFEISKPSLFATMSVTGNCELLPSPTGAGWLVILYWCHSVMDMVLWCHSAMVLSHGAMVPCCHANAFLWTTPHQINQGAPIPQPVSHNATQPHIPVHCPRPRYLAIATNNTRFAAIPRSTAQDYSRTGHRVGWLPL